MSNSLVQENRASTLQKETLWKLRRRVAEVVKMAGFTIEEDTVMFGQKQLDLMRAIKQAFDPNNILNAGKILPQTKFMFTSQ